MSISDSSVINYLMAICKRKINKIMDCTPKHHLYESNNHIPHVNFIFCLGSKGGSLAGEKGRLSF